MKRFLLLVLAGIALFAFILITSLMWYKLFYNDSAITPVSSIDIYLDDENNTIDEGGLIPLDANTAKSLTPYEFKVTNTSDSDTTYNVLLEDSIISDDANYSNKELLSRSQLEYQLSLNGDVIKQGMLTDIKNNVLDTRVINPNKVNNYELRIYVSEKAQTTDWQNKYYHFNVKIQAEDI